MSEVTTDAGAWGAISMDAMESVAVYRKDTGVTVVVTKETADRIQLASMRLTTDEARSLGAWLLES